MAEDFLTEAYISLKDRWRAEDSLQEAFCRLWGRKYKVSSLKEAVGLLSFDEAFEVARKTFRYTNHTVMREALECWDLKLMNELSPELVKIIRKILFVCCDLLYCIIYAYRGINLRCFLFGFCFSLLTTGLEI